MIWRDYRIDGIDLAPLFDAHGRRITFGRWCLTWLDEAEEQTSGTQAASLAGER